MNVLGLYLSPMGTGRMKIIAHPYGETTSVLPLRGNSSRKATILKALNADTFEPEDFDGPDEQEWMVRVKLLGSNRNAFHPEMRVNIGKILYKALFPPGSLTERKLQEARYAANLSSKHEQVVIQLEIEAGQARLFDYPWELLHDRQDFLAERGIAISRYINYEDPLPDVPRIKRTNVLLASSSAFDEDNGMQELSEEENQAVLKGVQEAEQDKDKYIRLEQLKPVTFQRFGEYLLEHSGEDTPHIIHFDGHGCFGILCNNILPDGRVCRTFHYKVTATECEGCSANLSGPQGYLLFEDGQGGAHYVSARDIGSTIGNANRSNKPGQGIVLVVLSACKSSSALIEDTVFNGVAQSLISHQIPAVVGMSFSVNASSATSFAEIFYRALSQKHSLALAINWGRGAMGGFGENQWYRPALYLRWRDNEGGQIFDVRSRKTRANRKTGESQTAHKEDRVKRNSSQLGMYNPPTTIHPGTRSSNDILTLAFTYHQKIQAEQSRFTDVAELFSNDDIWSDECGQAVNSLLEISKPVKKLCNLLDELVPSQLTETVVELRYALMTPLHNSDESLDGLVSDITAFSKVC